MTNQEIREEWVELYGDDFDGGNRDKYADWWLEKLEAQKQEFREMVEKYIEENRHKVERADRYVLDQLLGQ